MINKVITVKRTVEGKELADIVFQANNYKSSMHLKTEKSNFNLKSLMGMFALNLNPDTEVTLVADGRDEVAAMYEMLKIFDRDE